MQFWNWAVQLFPFEFSLTLYEAAAQPETMRFTLWGAVIVLPIVIGYCCFSNYFVVNFLIKLSLADLWQIILMGKGRVPRPFRLSVCF